MSDVDLYTVNSKVRTLESRVERLEAEHHKELERRTEQAKARSERAARKTERLWIGRYFVLAIILAVSITIAATKAVVAP